MAYNIGATVAVNGDDKYNAALRQMRTEMRSVNSEAKLVTSTFGKNEKSVASLTAANTNLRRVQEVQTKAVAETRAAMERLKAAGVDPTNEAYIKLEQNLNETQAALNNTEREIEGNTAAMAELAKTEATAKMESLGKTIAVVGAAAAAVAIAIAAAAKAAYNLADSAAANADALLTQSVQLGVSTDTLQKWTYAARFVDTEVETMTKGLAKTVAAMGDAISTGQDYIEIGNLLKVSMVDTNGILLGSEAVYMNAIDAIGALSSETEKEIAAQDLFGKSYQDMMPLIQAGSAAIAAYGEEAEQLGIILDSNTVKQLGKLDDALQVISAQGEGLKNTFAASIAEPMTEIAKTVSEVMRNITTSLKSGSAQLALQKIGAAAQAVAVKLGDLAVTVLPKLANAALWLVDNFKTLVTVVGAITGAFVALKAAMAIVALIKSLNAALAASAVATKIATIAQHAYNAALNACPAVAVAAAIAALTFGVVRYITTTSDAAQRTKEITTELEDSITQIQDANAAYKVQSDTIAKTEETVDGYIDTISRLGNRQDLTTSEAAALTAAVAGYNRAVSGASLTVDANTGKLSENAEAIRAAAAASMAYSKYQANTSRRSALQTELEKTKAAAESARAQMSALALQYIGLKGKWAENPLDLSIPVEMAAVDKAYQGLADSVALSDTTVSSLENSLESVQVEIDAYELQMNEAAAATDAQTAAQEALDEQLKLLSGSYEWAAGRVEYYAGYTQDAFSRIKQESAVSMQDMIANLQANQAAVASWSDNLQLLAEGGLNEGFLQTLREAGPEGAATVQGLVDEMAKGADFSEFNAVWEEGATTANEAVMTELETLPDETYVVGEDSGQGLADGIRSKIIEVMEASGALGTAAVEAARAAIDAHSPSRKFAALGVSSGEGYIIGLQSTMSDIASVVGSALSVPSSISSASSIAMRPTAGGSVVNLTVTDPSPAFVDYMLQRFNVQLGGAIA